MSKTVSRKTDQPQAAPSPAQLERLRWEGRMKIWTERGRSHWPRDAWGPVPGEP